MCLLSSSLTQFASLAQLEEKYKAKPGMRLNFPVLEKKQGIGNGRIIKLLDALNDDELKPKPKWTTPEPSDFDCVPSRPGVAGHLHEQKHKIARAQQTYRARKRWERERALTVEEDEKFGPWGETVGPSKNQTEGVERAPDSPSVLSAHTSITVLRSEVSVPMTPGKGER